MKLTFSFVIGLLCLIPTSFTHAQEIVEDRQEIIKAKVIEILSERSELIPGTDTNHKVEKIRIEVLEGEVKGKVLELDNDFIDLSDGDIFYLKRIIPWEGGKDLYSVYEPYRTPSLLVLTILFIVLTIIFGGKQGLRGLLSLGGSLVLIGFVLLPAILKGYSPFLTSIGISSLIIILGSYITHGFNKTTTSAVVGMILTISVIGIFAYYSIHAVELTGFDTDEATYLHFNTQGRIDLAGLLLGGILIGLLGVMYDAAIGQAISVEELHRVAPHIPRRTIYKRAIRIGREHIGALVNTLAIAYVGASLPLLLLFYASSESSVVIINREIFSTEIVRSLIGSIGLILAVPITTLISVWMIISKKDVDVDQKTLEKEKHELEHAGHHH
jgi:uncharacterized membrane protein